MAIQANVASYQEVEAMVKSVADEFGRLDILVNNAGVMFNKKIEAVTEDGVVRDYRLAAGSVAPTTVRLRPVEEALVGRTWEGGLAAEAQWVKQMLPILKEA